MEENNKIHIDIKQFEMANEKEIQPLKLYIDLCENYFIYRGEYYCEHPVAEDHEDHTLGWKSVYQNFTKKIKRQNIVGIEKRWNNKREIWIVDIEVDGFSELLSCYFETEHEADFFFNTFDEYIFGKEK